jgi:hypothetical protein
VIADIFKLSNVRKLLFFFISTLALSSCKVSYSFTGADVGEAETISIAVFESGALEGPANLGPIFTESMRDYFQRNTPLDPASSNGDLEFSGEVSSYQVKQVAQGANQLQNAELQRLEITVSVDFINNYDPDASFTRKFSSFQDFGADQNLQDVEDELIEVIFDQVITDIFNASVANW